MVSSEDSEGSDGAYQPGGTPEEDPGEEDEEEEEEEDEVESEEDVPPAKFRKGDRILPGDPYADLVYTIEKASSKAGDSGRSRSPPSRTS